MSERAAAFGTLNPPRVIEHRGKTYAICSVMTEGTLARVEGKMYERAKSALMASRDLYTREEFEAERNALRAKFEAGAFGFTRPDTLAHLQTDAGAVLLLGCMVPNADTGELLKLLTERSDEIQELLNDALELSFPKEAAPPA